MSVNNPTTELQLLEQLGSQGQLSGVNPQYLAIIAQEESGYEQAGAGINSSNYGGYFGLSTQTAPPSVLMSQSQQSFVTQAVDAAKIFAAGLKASGGNVYGAENYYQTGSTEGNAIQPNSGAALFEQYLTGGAKLGGAGVRPVSPQASGSAAAPATTSGGGRSWALSLQNVLNPNPNNAGFLGIPGALGEWGARLGLIAVGLILFLGGLAVIGVSTLLPRMGGAPARAAVGAIKGAVA